MPLTLFQAYGVELECMIVDARTLSVRPIADKLLRAAADLPEADVIEDADDEGEHEAPVAPTPDPQPGEVALGPVSWSNELAAHVIEFKGTDPVDSLRDVGAMFAQSIARANELLAPHEALILPGAMHPLMDPARELTLWPHGNSAVYQTFDRIFTCAGHGWANLQSAHLNLPFADPGPYESEQPDGEFGRLHAAIRLLLPVLPALAAASPIVEGRFTGLLDNRLAVYRTNSRRVPSVAGAVIPEPVFTRRAYQQELLEGIYRDLAPLDSEGMLRHEWVNARGAIARFSRNTIEVRVLDAQECPAADAAILGAVAGVLKALVGERWADTAAQQAWPTEPLAAIFTDCVRDADGAIISDRHYLDMLGYPRGAFSASAGELWTHLIETCVKPDRDAEPWLAPLQTILSQGCLAKRMLNRLGVSSKAAVDVDRDRITDLCRSLSRCPLPAPDAPGGVMLRA